MSKPKIQPEEQDDSEARILEAATELMGERGSDGTSMQSIADQAGVNKALVFYYFRNKAQLFERVLEGHLAGLHDSLAALSDERACGPSEHLHRMTDAWIDYIEDNPNYPRMVQRELSNAQGRHDLLAEYNQRNYALVERFIAPVAGARRSTTAPHQLFTSFVGMVLYYYISAPVLETLINDPLGRAARAARRRHLHWMVDAMLGSLDPH